MLSKRSERYMKPSMNYIPTFIKFMSNKYDPENNASGDISMCVAENSLVADIILPKIKSFNDYTPAVLNYTATTGMPEARLAIAQFLGDYMFHSNSIDPNNIVLSSGCCALLVTFY